MHQALSTRLRDERGVALITAVMISMIVMILGITAVSVSVHNSDASARDRRRVQSIGSAEAGLDYYFSHLQNTEPDEISCGISKSLVGSPTAGFEVSAEFFDPAGNPIACSPSNGLGETVPDSVLITSRGTTSGIDPTRTMQSFVYLIPKPPTPFGEYAIFSDGSPSFNSNIQVISGAEVNADVYTNGNLVLDSNAVINGSVFAQGYTHLKSNAEVKRNVWARNWVQLESQTVLRGNATSSTSYVTVSGNGKVYGDAQAGTTVSGGPSNILGLRIPNTPSDPPPSRSFPPYTFDAQDWIDNGYTVHTFSSCASARTFIQGITGGDKVVRITAVCELTFGSNTAVNVRGNLAIISNGSLRMDSNSSFQNVGSPHTLFLFFGYGGTPVCTNGIQFRSNTSISSGITTLFWTPCTVDINSNAFVAEGQMFGGSVTFNSNSNLTYKQVPVPGLAPGGFNEDITYIREVITDPDPI